MNIQIHLTSTMYAALQLVFGFEIERRNTAPHYGNTDTCNRLTASRQLIWLLHEHVLFLINLITILLMSKY